MFCLVLNHISTYFHHRKLDTRLNDLQGAPNHTYPLEPSLLRPIACRAGVIQRVSAQYLLNKNYGHHKWLWALNIPPQVIRSTFDLAISPIYVGRQIISCIKGHVYTDLNAQHKHCHAAFKLQTEIIQCE